jgi:hypothetical protein
MMKEREGNTGNKIFNIFYFCTKAERIPVFVFCWSVKEIIARLLQASFRVKQAYLTYIDIVGSVRGVCVCV